MTIVTIARLTFLDASRRRVVWVALILGALFLGIYALGVSEITHQINSQLSTDMPPLMVQEGYNFLAMAGLYVVNFLMIFMTILISLDTLSGELNTGVVHTLVSKPLHRSEIILGKWLGFGIMSAIYLVFVGGGLVLIFRAATGTAINNAILGLLLIELNALVLLSVSLLGGALFSTIANGVAILGLYAMVFIGGWIEQFGSMVNNTTAMRIGAALHWLLPTDALWRQAARLMESPLLRQLGGMSMFAPKSASNTTIIVYAVFYTAALLGLTCWILHRRDL